jgi:hypothetical protein
MQIIPLETFQFARAQGISEQHRLNAIKIANQCLSAGTSRGMAYLAGKRYLRNIKQQHTQGGAA